jgi:hypothetical protein
LFLARRRRSNLLGCHRTRQDWSCFALDVMASPSPSWRRGTLIRSVTRELLFDVDLFLGSNPAVKTWINENDAEPQRTHRQTVRSDWLRRADLLGYLRHTFSGFDVEVRVVSKTIIRLLLMLLALTFHQCHSRTFATATYLGYRVHFRR